MKKFYVIGIALLAMFAFSAVAASSASAEGPWWIILLGAELHRLNWPEEEKLLGEQDEVPFTLDGSVANIECPELHISGNLIGNNPGMDLGELEFLKCHVAGLPNCLAGNITEDSILVEVLSVLVYWDNNGTEVLTLGMVAFFTDNTASDLFTEFTLKNASGSTECGVLLNGLKVNVNATGTNVGEVGETGHKVNFAKKCGVLAEIGLLNASKVFEEQPSGVEHPMGVLNTENTVLTAFLLNVGAGTLKESVLIECLLEAFGAEAKQLGLAKIDLESGNEFGWEED